MSAWKIDFSGVEDYGDVLPSGQYAAMVRSVERKPGTESPYLEWVLVVAKGEHKGKTIKYITSLSPKALFNLRNFLICLGIDVPKSSINLDPDKVIKRTLGIEVGPRPNKDKTKTYQSVVNVFPLTSSGTSTPTVKAAPAVTAESEMVMDLGDDDVPF